MDLCGTDSFGVPLLSPAAPFSRRLAFRDVFVRAGWRRLAHGGVRVQQMPGSQEIGE